MPQNRERTQVESAVEWYLPLSPSSFQNHSEICSTRDIFQARLDTFYQESLRLASLSEDEASLLIAVVGEIGNNCFDHNLGQWPDHIGCWFSWTFQKGVVYGIVADRGQGILNSLKRVKPDLVSETEALSVAFEKRISGRSPEKRGNGLKFVRSIMNGHVSRGLLFFSGPAGTMFGGNKGVNNISFHDKLKQKVGTGTFAFISWEKA